ncbi:hypothetical protein FGO68_gene5841 [Halteria grandinella]|uniref:Phospholipid-transporting ATPase n=1 Tax=Halteria grandinella TaxID=5974 RepID=A0A8J8T8Q8_HALGN|nr:hypothetical protein FGO68_gene5841 [Halteria grandinella]
MNSINPLYDQPLELVYSFSFLPVSMFIQFARVTNDFYVVNFALQSTPQISSNSPLATLFPLLFVIILGMIRELVADLKRWKEDRITNSRKYACITSNGLIDRKEVLSQELRVGDIIEINDGQTVPADCLLLSAPQANGQCFLQTSSLDGEKNLKQKLAIKTIQDNIESILKNGVQQTNENSIFEVRCQEPERNLYYFKGEINYRPQEGLEKSFDLDLKQFLHQVSIEFHQISDFYLEKFSQYLISLKTYQQGTILRNSGTIIAMVLYCGKETKIILNQGKYTFKQSEIEKKLNYILLSHILIILSLAGILASQLKNFIDENGSKMKYVYPETNIDSGSYASYVYGTYFLLFNSLVPLAFIIELELIKMSYSPMIENDLGMSLYVDDVISHKNGITEEVGMKNQFEYQQTRVQNVSLHEQLGQVSYILCDKTGTITKNELAFRAISDVSSDESPFHGDVKDLEKFNKTRASSETYHNLWRCIALCHDVLLINLPQYSHAQLSGASQDEIHLLQAGEHSKFASLEHKDSEYVTIKLSGKEEKYKIIKSYEFTSERKMMSVVLKRESDAKILLFTKGADGVILPRASQTAALQVEHNENMHRQVNEFAEKGYRTLIFAMRDLTEVVQLESEFRNLPQEFLEKDFQVLGMTAMEDLLQDEVNECMRDFKEAGIKVWMLTGDKGETAHQIAYSCGIFSKHDQKEFLTFKLDEQSYNTKMDTHDDQQQLHEIMDKICALPTSQDYGLTISGTQIIQMQSNIAYAEKLTQIIRNAQSVVVYRCSPAQKAQVTSLVKAKSVKGSTTLSIGDGANDVNMIQTAHIGVGVFGKESNQAISFSDYAIPQFKTLRRLLFWHGRSFGVRFSDFSKWFLYKSLIMCYPFLFANIQSCFSGQKMMEDTYWALYHVDCTTIAILFYGIFEQDLSFIMSNNEKSIGFKISRYYKHSKTNIIEKTIPYFTVWHLYAFVTGIVFYYIPAYAYNEATFLGRQEGFWAPSFASICLMVVVHHVNCALGTKNWTFFMFCMFIISFLLFMPLTVFMNNRVPTTYSYMVHFSEGLKSPTFWLTLTITASIVVLPYYAVHCVWNLLMYPEFNVDQVKKEKLASTVIPMKY